VWSGPCGRGHRLPEESGERLDESRARGAVLRCPDRVAAGIAGARAPVLLVIKTLRFLVTMAVMR